jgi:omega-amidase
MLHDRTNATTAIKEGALRFAVTQCACVVGDSAANRATLADACREAARRGCSLLLAPELCSTGYDFAAARAGAEDRQGPWCAGVRALADEHRVTVVHGMSERDGARVFNTLAVTPPDGNAGTWYRKAHLFRSRSVDERDVFSAGDEAVVAPMGGAVCGLALCFDLRFPEFFHTLAGKGAAVLLIAAAWPRARIEHWRVLLRARAVDSQCFVVASNRVGSDNGLPFGGYSAIIDPWGTVLAEADGEQPVVLDADIDLSRVAATRERLPICTSRRAELYDATETPAKSRSRKEDQ